MKHSLLTRMSTRGRFIAGVAFAVCLAVMPLRAGAQEKQTFELGEKGFEKVAEPDPKSPEGELMAIRRLIADGKGKDAVEAAKDWIDNHPNHPLLPEAYLLRGDARVSVNHFFKALFDYEYICRQYPESSQFDIALDRELKVADTFASGVKRRLWGMRILPAYGEAEELYIRIQERAPGSKIAERAGIALADYYYGASQMGPAADAYELFLQNFPESQWREHAMQRQILSNLATFKGPTFDATGLIEAQRRLQDYKQSYPAAAEQIGADAMLTRVDETLATRDLLVARWYEHTGKRVSAGVMYQRVITDHPGSAAAKQALASLRALEPERFAQEPAVEPPVKATQVKGVSLSPDQSEPIEPSRSEPVKKEAAAP